MTNEMTLVLDEYFAGNDLVIGNYPLPFAGFCGDTSVTIERAQIESQIESGELANHPAVLDSIEQLQKNGKITSNYFPWIKQLAKEIFEQNNKGE